MTSLFKGPPKIKEKKVVEEPPKPMPIPDDEMVKKEKKRSMAETRRRSGRISTILTDTNTMG